MREEKNKFSSSASVQPVRSGLPASQAQPHDHEDRGRKPIQELWGTVTAPLLFCCQETKNIVYSLMPITHIAFTDRSHLHLIWTRSMLFFLHSYSVDTDNDVLTLGLSLWLRIPKGFIMVPISVGLFSCLLIGSRGFQLKLSKNSLNCCQWRNVWKKNITLPALWGWLMSSCSVWFILLFLAPLVSIGNDNNVKILTSKEFLILVLWPIFSVEGADFKW